MSDLGEAEGSAHMLLGNKSFSVPTQPAGRQQDTMAAMQQRRKQAASRSRPAPPPSSNRFSTGSVSVVRECAFFSFCKIIHGLVWGSARCRAGGCRRVQAGAGWTAVCWGGRRLDSSSPLQARVFWLALTLPCVSSASPSLMSAAPSCTSSTTPRTSRSTSALRFTAEGRCPFPPVCVGRGRLLCYPWRQNRCKQSTKNNKDS